MKRKRPRITRQEGGFLFIISLLTTISALTIMMVGLLRSLSALSISNRSIVMQQAFALSEAGIDLATMCVRIQPSSPACPIGNPTCVFDLSLGALGAACVPPALADSTYTVTVDPADTNPDSYIKYYTISVTATTNGIAVTRQITYIIKTESFARFAYFSDHESTQGGLIGYWITGNVFEGPYFTNDQMHLFGSPTFKDTASSVATTIDCSLGPCAPVFELGPPALGVQEVEMPNPSLNDLQSNASIPLTGNTTVELQGDAVLITNSGSTIAYSINTNPVIFVNGGDVTVVGGELDGQLTVGSNKDILLAGHARYRCDPETVQDTDPTNDDPDCKNISTGQIEYNDDILGLVAKKNIRIVTSAPNNLVVHASLMAMQGALKVDGHDDAARGPRGTFHVFGGLIQAYGGFTGMFDSSTGLPVSGYAEEYHYDKRFSSLSPPFFPTTGRYNGVFWSDDP